VLFTRPDDQLLQSGWTWRLSASLGDLGLESDGCEARRNPRSQSGVDTFTTLHRAAQDLARLLLGAVTMLTRAAL
jgi:hypothetical protein